MCNDSFIIYCEANRGQIGFLMDYTNGIVHTTISPECAERYDAATVSGIHKELNRIGVKHWLFSYHD